MFNKNKIRIILFFGVFIFFIVIATYFLKNMMFIIVDNMPLTLENYRRIFSSLYLWNDFLGTTSPSTTIFTLPTYLYFIGIIFHLSVTQILFIGKVFLLLIGYFGFFLLLSNLNNTLFHNKLQKISIHIGSLLYITAPSFLIGDHFWFGIQTGFYSVPILLFSLQKVILSNKFSYLLLTAWILSINSAIHFVFAGFPIFIVIYILFLNILKFKQSKIYKDIFFNSIIYLLLYALLYILMFAPNILGTFTQGSIADIAKMTTDSVYAPWSSATTLNLASGIGHNNLLVDYYSISKFEKIITRPIFLLIPFLIISTFLYIKKSNRQKKIDIALFFLVSLYLSVLLTFSIDSSFRFIGDFITFDTPFGRAFRTWRITDAIIIFALSFFSVLALNIFNGQKRTFLYGSLILVIIISILPIMKNNINGKIIITPKTYQSSDQYLARDSSVHQRVIYTPEFIASYGISDELNKPFWSKEMGMISEFLIYQSPISSIGPIGNRTFYNYTVSEFYKKTGNLLLNYENYALSRFLNFANVKYLVTHTDMPTSIRDLNINNVLAEDLSWESLYKENYLHIFKNKSNTNFIDIVNIEDFVLISGGYRTLKNYLNRTQRSGSNEVFVFDDGTQSTSELIKYVNLVTTNDVENTINNLIIQGFIYGENRNEEIDLIFPALYTNEYDPVKKWSTAAYIENHQQEIYPYLNKVKGYSWEFLFGKGVAFTESNNVILKLPLKSIHSKGGKNIMLVRHLQSDVGGSVNIGNFCKINTKGHKQGFIWSKCIIDSKNTIEDSVVKLINNNGFNMLSTIAVFPVKTYNDLYKDISLNLDRKKIIKTDNYTNIIDKNILQNMKFKIINNNFKLGIEDGSLRVEHIKIYDNDERWSWSTTDWIDVIGGHKYLVKTSIELNNVKDSHIAFIGYSKRKGREVQILQLPSAQSGTVNWREYEDTVLIPKDITKIRIVFNSGLPLDTKSIGYTRFGNVRMVDLYESIVIKMDAINTHSVVNFKKINPTLWWVNINNVTKPFILNFKEKFQPKWKISTISSDRHFILNSYSNGWYINPGEFCQSKNNTFNKRCTLNKDGSYDIEFVIEFTPQRWFYLGLLISGTTFVSLIGYLLVTSKIFKVVMLKVRRSKKLIATK